MPSKPWLQPPGHDVDPSTRLQTRHDTVGSPLGHNKVELPMTSEAELGGHKYYINSDGIPCGSPVQGYPMPS